MLTHLLNASAKIQSAVALGVAILCVAILGFASLSIFSQITGQHRQLIETRERAGKLLQFALIDLSTTTAQTEEHLSATDLFMDAPSIVIARADLQRRITEIANDHKAFISSAGNLPDLEQNSVKLIGLRMDFSGTYDDVLKTLLDIETSAPPLLVKAFRLNLTGVPRPELQPDLSAQLHVYSAVKIDGSSSERAGQPK